MTKIIYFIVNNRHVKITKQLLEQIIGEEIAAKNTKKTKLLTNCQHVFIKRRSYVTQLLTVMDYWGSVH